MSDSTRAVKTFRVNPSEQAILQNLCSFERLSASESIRLAIREAAQRRGLWTSSNASQNTHTSQPETPHGVESEGTV